MAYNRRLRDYNYRDPGGYFITINSFQKEPIFSSVNNGFVLLTEIGLIINKCWLETPNHFENITLGEHILMPNHFHGILIINYSLVGSKHIVQSAAWDASNLPIYVQKPHHVSQLPKTVANGTKSGSLSAIIQSFKSASTRIIHASLNTNNPVWQRSFYDHIIRDESELSKIHDYIVNNPFY
jgi:putative transposase